MLGVLSLRSVSPHFLQASGITSASLGAGTALCHPQAGQLTLTALNAGAIGIFILVCDRANSASKEQGDWFIASPGIPLKFYVPWGTLVLLDRSLQPFSVGTQGVGGDDTCNKADRKGCQAFQWIGVVSHDDFPSLKTIDEWLLGVRVP